MNKDTKHFLSCILKRYVEQEQLKETINRVVQEQYELAPMKLRVARGDVYSHVCDSLRLTKSQRLVRLMIKSLNSIGVRSVKIEGYHYFAGIKPRESHQSDE